MTLKKLSEIIDGLIAGYGDECPVESFVRKDEESKAPSIWYDEDEDAVFIH